MFAPREFPCLAWLSVLDTHLMPVVVMPITLLGYNTTTEGYAVVEVAESLHREFVCETQVSAIQRLIRVIEAIMEDRTHPIHHMTSALRPVHAALVSQLAIMKAKGSI